MRAPAAFCAALALHAAGAETLSVPAFVRGAEGEEALEAHRRLVRGSGGGSSGVPFLRDAEFQIRNEAFDFGRQRYTLQLSPKGAGETAAARWLNGALSGRDARTLEALRNQAVKERYRLVVDLLAARTLGGLHADLASLEEERIRVLERHSVSDAFDLGDILRAENSLTRHRERRDEARAVEALLLDRARTLAGAPAASGFDTAGFAGAGEVEAWLEASAAADAAGDTANVHLGAARNDVEAARAQYRLALAENRRYVSFVEFGYDHGNRRNEIEDRAAGREYDLDRAWIAEVGFRLPGFGSGRANILRRRAELLNREAGLGREREELARELRAERAALRALAARHRSIAARERELDVAARLRRYAALGAADPLVILALRQALLENALRREETRFELLRGYLDAADLAGEISRRPARNLLSRGREILDP